MGTGGNVYRVALGSRVGDRFGHTVVMAPRSVMWFRRDLRLTDNPALAAACESGSVLPLFVLDPSFAGAGAPRQEMLASCVRELRRMTDGALVVRHGDPTLVVPAVAAEVDAETVYVAKDFGPYGRRRDELVATALSDAGRRLRGVGSPYAVEPGGVVKEDGSGYSVFTPFARRWRAQDWEPPVEQPGSPNWIEARSDAELPAGSGEPTLPTVNESEVIDAWRQFQLDGLDQYAARRDFPAISGTSRLSPMLKFGVIHPRQLLVDCDDRDESHRTFQSELAWRDFYADVLYRRPSSAWENLDRRFDRLHVDTDGAARARFERWCSGHTGFPIVDAGMRQLTATGWMHNRVRMIVASFLVKDLHLPWQWGARFFMTHLLDGDLASNSHGWQWAAGCGTDAAPFFRVFNPTTQQERWDPDGEYVHRWIPELDTADYPVPLVDHRAERIEALARYEILKQR